MKKANFTKNQIPIDFSFVSEKTFDNFIHGNNGAIIKSLISFSDEDSTNIISIYGKKSSGKTHLCKATEKSTRNTFYLNMDNAESLDNKANSFSSLIIDDIDLFVKKL